MTDEQSAFATITDVPALSVAALRDLRVIVDRLLSFEGGESPPTNGGTHEIEPTLSSDTAVRTRKRRKRRPTSDTATIAATDHHASERGDRCRRSGSSKGGKR